MGLGKCLLLEAPSASRPSSDLPSLSNEPIFAATKGVFENTSGQSSGGKEGRTFFSLEREANLLLVETEDVSSDR